MSARPLTVAMLCAAAITAEFVGGKATRDALFLTALHPAALPAMLIATALCSILLVFVHTRLAGRVRPARLVPALFIVSGALFVGEWLLRPLAPAAVAIAVYLHVSGAGPLLASGFWLIASERFDPRTARARFGQIAGAGTLGGLLGALLSERVAAIFGAPPMLAFLGGLQLVAAWLVWVLAADTAAPLRTEARRIQGPGGTPTPADSGSLASGLLAVAAAPHLRHLMALVLLGTTSAALLEYLFKTTAVETFGSGDALLRFFAAYYAIASLATFGLQVFGSAVVLRRFGLALTTSAPSIALLAGSLGSLIAPGFGSLIVARAGESIFRGSWFRAGYEQFFAPLPPEEKRTAKPFVDVVVDRLGDAVGGGLVRLIVVFLPLAPATAILAAAMACALGAVAAASHLNRWYLRTLETSLVAQGAGIDLSDTRDGLTRAVTRAIDRVVSARTRRSLTSATTATVASFLTTVSPVSLAAKAEVEDVLSLRLGSRERVLGVLTRPEPPAAGLLPHIVPLLAWDAVADAAMTALRRVADARTGTLLDVLLDPATNDTVRRRLARVFAVCRSQRAADGLLLALDDRRFDVRFQVARSLAAVVEHNPEVHVTHTRVEAVVLGEVAVGRPIWESRQLLAGAVSESPLDAFVKDRASQSLAHVFTLLSLVLPKEPLQIAFRGLTSRDQRLRGTALEYLEEVLPPTIRDPLWPFLAPSPVVRPGQARAEIVSRLLREPSSPTLVDLARRHG